MGKYLGCVVFCKVLIDFGYGDIFDDKVQYLFGCFKDFVDCKGQIYVEDFCVLVDVCSDVLQIFSLEGFQIILGMNMMLVVFVCLYMFDGLVDVIVYGDGLVEVVFQVISKIIGISFILESYCIQLVMCGDDVFGEVSIYV